ncbi:aquaporin-like protein [Syncephalis fuscata]|nr:aquaporin-like protein [Syncephalis fuscata]
MALEHSAAIHSHCGNNQVPDMLPEEQSLLGHRISASPKPLVAFLSTSWAPFRIIRRIQSHYRDYLAEFFATYIFLFIGLTQCAGNVSNFPSYFTWGLALMCGIFVGRSVSSGHVNPAVTLGFALFRNFPKRKVLGYWLAQGLGAFLAAATVYGLFHSSIDRFDGGNRQVTGDQATGDIFYVVPQTGTSLGNRFSIEVIGTMLLMIVICCTTDRYNNRDIGALFPVTVGLILTAILMSLAYEKGLSLNPARDLGPRLFTLIFYGAGAFSNNGYYFWVVSIAPLIGACLACFCYDILVPSTPLGAEYSVDTLHSNELSNAESGRRHYLATSSRLHENGEESALRNEESTIYPV